MPAGTTDIEPARILLPRVETQQEASGGTRAVRSGQRPGGFPDQEKARRCLRGPDDPNPSGPASGSSRTRLARPVVRMSGPGRGPEASRPRKGRKPPICIYRRP